MQDQRRHVEPLEILGEIGLRECLDAVERGLVAAQHALQPEGVAQPLGDFGPGPVETVEGKAEILEELRAISQHCGADLIERSEWQAARVLGRLKHQRRNGADQYGFGDTFRSVTADVTGDFAAPGGVTDVDRIAKIERGDKFCKVIGISIHLSLIHISEPTRRTPISYAVFCLKKKK